MPALESIHENARRRPAALALASRTGHMSYRDLAGNIASAARMLRTGGIAPGNLVYLACANPDARLILALALMQHGCRIGYSRDIAPYRDVGLDVVLADKPDPASAVRVAPVGPDWFRPGKGPPKALSAAPGATMVFASSGSTGRPKLMEFTMDAIAHRVASRSEGRSSVAWRRHLSTSGLATTTTFIDTLITLTRGGTVVRSLGRDIPTVFDTIALFRPDYMTMGPADLRELVGWMATNDPDFERIATLRVGGAFCPPTLRAQARETIAHRIITSFGATETGRVAWADSDDRPDTPGYVGRVVEGVEVGAFDAGNRRLPPGEDGALRVRAPAGTEATYVASPGIRNETFRDGWFVTGDIGHVDADGNLVLRGRASNVINAGGNKVHPEVLEEHLGLLGKVRDVGVTGVTGPEGDQLVCVAVVSAAKLTRDDLNAFLLKRRANIPVDRVIGVEAIPRTDNGKIDRNALRRLASDLAVRGVSKGR